MRVLVLAGREKAYARNAVILRAFERFATVDVITTNATTPLTFLWNFSTALRGLYALYSKSYDLVFIGFYGYIILYLLHPFLRQPVLFDAFISNFDTLCFDRKIFTPSSLFGRIAFQLDRFILRQATHILLDTQKHVEYFVETFDISIGKFSVLPVGCRDDIFTPNSQKQRANIEISSSNGIRTRVLYYCTYLPLHGVEIVLNAAKMLENEPFDFYLIGNGPQYRENIKRARTLALSNLIFQPSVSISALAVEIEKADICLGGHFGESAKADRVVPGKIYQMLAMGKPIIATNMSANNQLLQHGETAYLIAPNNATELACAISTLNNDRTLQQKISHGGRLLYTSSASEMVITEQLRAIVSNIHR